MEQAVPVISPQQAADGRMFGPMYHGTRVDLGDIIAQGFDVERSIPATLGRLDMPAETSNGYEFRAYGLTGIAPPIHHLGFGPYFSTVRAVAKAYAGGTTKGQRSFYLDSQRVLKINFGSENTMMRWWQQHGYDMTVEATKRKDMTAWIAATHHLTETLRRDYDAVHFLGKGLRRLLDGDQVCVYNPSLIRVVDPKLAGDLEIGSKVLHTQEIPAEWRELDNVGIRPEGDGWRALFNTELVDRYPSTKFHMIPPPNLPGVIKGIGDGKLGRRYEVKWLKGGTMMNYRPEELKPYTKTISPR